LLHFKSDIKFKAHQINVNINFVLELSLSHKKNIKLKLIDY